MTNENQLYVAIKAVLDKDEWKHNPAAKVSALLSLIDKEGQQTILLDFVKHVAEVVSFVFNDQIRVHNLLIDMMYQYQNGEIPFGNIAEQYSILWDLRHNLFKKTDKQSKILSEVSGALIGVTLALHHTQLQKGGYIHKGQVGRTNYGTMAYGMAQVVAKSLQLNEKISDSGENEKNQIHSYSLQESEWQIQKIVDWLDTSIECE